MKKHRKFYLSIIVGLLLAISGILLLLKNLNILQFDLNLVVAPALALGGLVFLVVFLSNRQQWWALIPAMALMGLGSQIFLEHFPEFQDKYGFAIFFGFIGLAFWLIYLTHRNQWWAIIPGGVLWTLALASIFPEGSQKNATIFFTGMALTFILVFWLAKMKWALVPATIMVLMGVLFFFKTENLLLFVGPSILLAAGAVLLYYALRRK